MATDFNERARRPHANAGKSVAVGGYFAPEAQKAYEGLGFVESPVTGEGVTRLELKSYFASRGASVDGPATVARTATTVATAAIAGSSMTDHFMDQIETRA